MGKVFKVMFLKQSCVAEKILVWRREKLAEGGSPGDLNWLLDIGAGLNWVELQKLRINKDTVHTLNISLKELSIIWRKHLQNQIPLQYLIGKCYWRDFELEVNPSVLIPRQETELMVDIVLSKINPSLNHFGRWVDLGTGSGALAVALANQFPGWLGHAVDCSKEALVLAKKNIENLVLHSNKISLHEGDWWEPLAPWMGNIDLVVANPPYIPESDMSELDFVVRDHEPHVALLGGSDGMDALRQIIKGAINYLSSGGWLFVEHNFDQSERVLDLFNELGFKEVDFANDLEGIKRFGLGRLP